MHFFHNFFLFPSGFTAKILNALFLTVTDIHTDSQAHQACDNTLVHSITPITDSMDTVLSVIPSFLLFFNKNTVKIRRDAVFLMHVVIAVADFDDFSDISVVHLILRLILQLQNLVMLTEQTIAYLQLFFI